MLSYGYYYASIALCVLPGRQKNLSKTRVKCYISVKHSGFNALLTRLRVTKETFANN